MSFWKITIIALLSSSLLLTSHTTEAWCSSSSIARPAALPPPLFTGFRYSSGRQQERTRLHVINPRSGDSSRAAPRKRSRQSTPTLHAVFVDEAEANMSSMAMNDADDAFDETAMAMTTATPQEQIEASGVLPDWANKKDREEMISKIINALFLAACFGFAFTAIVDVNHGITRGWSQQEIALRIPLDTWSSYEVALEEKPIATKTMINVIIYLLGDWLSQTVFAKRNVLDFDLLRTLRNGLIGLGFGPLVHEYYQFSDAILPVEGGVSNRILKIFMDQTIYLSIKCSMYIFAVNILQGEDLKTSTGSVKEKLPSVVKTAWKFWPLIHCITYSVIPARHRILWVNCVDLIWNAILASMSQKTPDAAEDEQQLLLEQEPMNLSTAILESSTTQQQHQQQLLEVTITEPQDALLSAPLPFDNSLDDEDKMLVLESSSLKEFNTNVTATATV
mmetsp:Transcript_21374/g.27628  ORF Transcript_21374/g.27628 Transcript_21374/m.27628 type:complete len:449 (-) Transcript_21374:339-1685(-)